MQPRDLNADLEKLPSIMEIERELSFPLVIDSSMRANLAACPRKFYWSFIRRLRPAVPSIHLHAGGCFAKGLETFRREFYGNGQDFASARDAAWYEMISFWDQFEPTWSWENPPWNKTLDAMLCALDHYFSVWPPADDAVKPLIQNGKPAIEFSFAVPIEGTVHPETGTPLIYAGRTDMLAIYNDVLFVEDDKTTTQLGASWNNQWDLRSQFTGYCYAARSYGYPVGGVIVRGISILKNSYGNAQVVTYRPDWMIERWHKQLVRDINRAIQCWRDGWWDYALDDACTAYGGCPFRNLCDKNDPERWINGYYEPNTWHPLLRGD